MFSRRGASGGLTRRLVAASVLLALVVAGGFVVMLLAIGDLRADDRRARHSQRVTVAANQLERLLLDLETGQRGFALTHEERFLQPWTAARASFPARARTLLALVAGDRTSEPLVRAIVRAERSYIEDYSQPLVEAARRRERRATSVALAVAGKRRVDAIRGQFDRLLGPLQRESAASTALAERATRRAATGAALGLGGSLLLIVLYVAYLRRAIVAPVRRAAAMAGRIAGGDLGARLPEKEVGEVGALERAFNVMSRSLAESQAELTASRARIVATADETRRRIERDLHDGAQQRLVSLALELRAAQAEVPPELRELRAELDDVAGGLSDVMEELREIARGIHPAILAEGGLGPALRTLARRSPVPVRLDVRIDGRLPEPVEVGAYYVVSEALTNAAKHARASSLDVDVEAGDGELRVSVRDDGVGGAQVGRGSGLVGLKDRVDALGGRISIDSPPGAGTTVRAVLPLHAPS